MKNPDDLCKEISQTVIQAGGAACRTPKRRDGFLTYRLWQTECHNYLEEALLRTITAPTGGGKSTVIRGLLWCDVRKGHKAIVSVPQTIIGRSFDRRKILLPDGSKAIWEPGEVLLDSVDHVGRLKAFIQEPAGATPSSRILLCTHSTLVRAYHEMPGYQWNSNGPISLAIDEAHRTGMGSETEDGETPDSNGMGDLVRTWLREGFGPLTLATATWIRGDFSNIISPEALKDFRRYHLTADKYLASMEHLKEIVFTYMIGKPEDILEKLHEKPRRTIMFMRPLLMDPKRKLGFCNSQNVERLGRYLNALGPYRQGSKKTREEHLNVHSSGLRSVDLVDTQGRKARKTAFLATLDAIYSDDGDPSSVGPEPDLVSAIYVGKLGFDWPACDTVVIDQKRHSYVDQLQMNGRGLRDYEGKERCEIVTMLDPLDRNAPDYKAKIRDYLKTILASMVIEWQFRSPRFPKNAKAKVKKAIEEFRTDPEKGAMVLGAVGDAHVRGVSDEGLVDVIHQSLDEIGDYDEEEKEALTEFVQGELLRKSAEVYRASDIPFNPNLERTTTGCIEMYAYAVGADTLAVLRESLRIPLAKLEQECRDRGIKTPAEYAKRYRDIPGAPADPRTYKEWVNWRTFFTGRMNAIALGRIARKERQRERRRKHREWLSREAS